MISNPPDRGDIGNSDFSLQGVVNSVVSGQTRAAPEGVVDPVVPPPLRLKPRIHPELVAGRIDRLFHGTAQFNLSATPMTIVIKLMLISTMARKLCANNTAKNEIGCWVRTYSG
jgi:hypothetical protein